MLSAHSYFTQRKCSKCHQQTMSIVSGGNSQTSREPSSASGISPDPALILELGICLKCHENPFAAKESLELQTHAPVRCSVCHVPHQSEYSYLLKSEPSEICTMCHMDEKRSGKDFHKVPLNRDYSD
jgi:predicted CXXCH cytochrome family protein